MGSKGATLKVGNCRAWALLSCGPWKDAHCSCGAARVLLVSRQKKRYHSDVKRFAHQMAALRYVSSILAERDVHEAAVQAQARGPRGRSAGTKRMHEM